jgi:hypothetical protein
MEGIRACKICFEIVKRLSVDLGLGDDCQSAVLRIRYVAGGLGIPGVIW